MSIIIKSGATADVATVDPSSKGIRVGLYDPTGDSLSPDSGVQVGTGVSGVLAALQDEGGIAVPARGGKIGSLGIGTGNMLFLDDFESTTAHASRYTGALTTMTIAQTTTGLNLNSGASAATSAVTVLNSARRFERRMNQPLDMMIRARVSAVTNSVVELGFGDTTSGITAIVNNGAFFRYAGTSLTPVIAFNGTEVTGSAVDMSANGANYYDYGVVLEDMGAVFIVKSTLTGAVVNKQRLNFTLSQSKSFSTSRIPLMLRVYNSSGSAPASAPVFLVGSISVMRLDDSSAVPFSDALAGLNLAFDGNPATGAQTANYANSVAPTSATLSNTAAGYTTLGGQWQFAAVAGAETDYCLFGFQVPAPFSFICTGVHIEAINTGAAVATTATILQWGIGVNSTAVSLATALGFPSAAPYVRSTIGNQSFAVGAAIGATATPLDVQFRTPLFTGAGRFISLILKMPVGTATASQVVRGTAVINGYFL